MSQQDHHTDDLHFSKWVDSITPLENNLEIVQPSVTRERAIEEAEASIARQLNGPLTAVLLYMNEIKQHQFFADTRHAQMTAHDIRTGASRRRGRGMSGLAEVFRERANAG